MNDVPPQRRGRPRDAAIDRAILDATLEELGTSGFQGMSMDGIAERAEVSKPTIYRRWPNKPTLAIAAIRELVSKEPPLTGEAIDDLSRQLRSADSNLEQSASVALVGVLLAERDRHPMFIQAYRDGLLTPRRDVLGTIIEEAQNAGDVRPDVDLDTATLLLLGFLFASYIAGEKVSDERVRAAVSLLWTGLSAGE